MTSPVPENKSEVSHFVRFTDQDVNKPAPTGGYVQSTAAIFCVFKKGLIRGATPAEYFNKTLLGLQDAPEIWRPTGEVEMYKSFERALRRNADGSIPN